MRARKNETVRKYIDGVNSCEEAASERSPATIPHCVRTRMWMCNVHTLAVEEAIHGHTRVHVSRCAYAVSCLAIFNVFGTYAESAGIRDEGGEKSEASLFR